MTLTQVNHVITEIKTMLQGLVDAETITEPEAKLCFPVILASMLRNEAVIID